MGLFGKKANEKKEESFQDFEEERVLEITPEIQELIDQGKWLEILEDKVYFVYKPYDVQDMQLKIFDVFCNSYPNVKENAKKYLFKVCSNMKGYYEVPVEKYLHDKEFDIERYSKTARLHNYNPILNFIRDAKDITFTREHILCLNNMCADEEIDETDFFIEMNSWLFDSSLFVDGKGIDETRKLILLKKYEGETK